MSKQTTPSAEAEEAVPGQEQPAQRAPYEPPRITSGPIFERVVLTSHCNPVVFECDPPVCE